MVQKVDFLLFDSIYDSCRYMTVKWMEAFARAGVMCRALDFADCDIREAMDRMLGDPPDSTFCVACKGAPWGTLFAQEVGIPHFCHLVDASIYFEALFTIPNVTVGCIDANDCSLQRDLYGRSAPLFLPHAADSMMKQELDRDRPYDVVLLGAFFDCDYLREGWRRRFSSSFFALLEALAEQVLVEPHTAFVPLFLQQVEPFVHELQGQPLFSLLLEFENYFRAYDRMRIVRAIRSTEVHIFGPNLQGPHGWQEYFKEQDNIIIHPPVSFQEAFSIMQQSKIVLNSTPSYKQGGHERIFNGLALGALVLTLDTPFIRTHFRVEEELAVYTPPYWEAMDDTIRKYLDNEPLRRQVVIHGGERVQREHTWDQRVKAFYYKNDRGGSG